MEQLDRGYKEVDMTYFSNLINKVVTQIKEVESKVDNLLECSKKFQKPMLSIKESAEYIGRATSFVYCLVRNRELPTYVVGKNKVIKRDDLDAYLTRERNNSEKEDDDLAERLLAKLDEERRQKQERKQREKAMNRI